MDGVIGTLIVAGILVVIVGLIIHKMVLDKKKGKSILCGGKCGGDCSNCGGKCH